MKKLFFFIISMLVWINAASIIVETASFTDFLYGNAEECEYDNWISHVVEGIADEDYNLYSPWDVQSEGFGTFILPDESMLEQWQYVIDAFLAGNYFATQNILDLYDFPYHVVEFNDTDTGNTYYLLREVLNFEYYDGNGTIDTYDDELGSFDYGWGLFIHNPQSTNPIIITVPHPNDDFISSVIGYKCFDDWNAKFLLISGAGREVLWTNQGSYFNSKSLCDPSRNDDVVFNVTYKSFCNNIREVFNKREFSAQIHSYDWNRHDDHPDNQISAMHSCPNLPIRDLSDLHLDMINASDHVVIPQNTIGPNTEVLLNDYYSVYYSIYDFLFYNWEGDPYPVNDNVDLPGYSGNKQKLYTYSYWNSYDVFDPFFHLEMDELPGCYEESEENYHWFYGFDPETNMFQMDMLFDKTLSYYSQWIDSMTEILPAALELDDGIIPLTPQSFAAIDIDHDSIDLIWDPISSYDFHTYEIFFANEPINPNNYTIIDRDDVLTFASPLKNSHRINYLDLNSNYFFQIRAVDKNGNYSPLSVELEVFTSPARITDLVAIGLDSIANIKWTAVQQSGNMGFNIYRKLPEEEFIQIDSWTTNPELAGTQNPYEEYSYFDAGVENGLVYTYQISSVNENGEEFLYYQLRSCSPNDYFQIYVFNSISTIIDSVTFSKNQFATDYQDADYDLEKIIVLPEEYIFSAFYEEYWMPNDMYLQQQVHGEFSPFENYKVWDLKVKTNQLNEQIEISVSPEFMNDNGNLFLKDLLTDQIIDMTIENHSFFAEDTTYYNFELYWGDLHPYISFTNFQNQLLQGGDELLIEWNSNVYQLIDYFDISLQNDETTIAIAEYVDRLEEQYIWITPEDIEIHNAQIVIGVHSIDGTIYEFDSTNLYGILPLEYTIDFTEGWQLITNPWISDETFFTSEIFGINSELLFPIPSNNFESSEEFEFGTGYWLNAELEGSFTHSDSILKEITYFALEPGWNLVPNSYLCSYDLRDLKIKNSVYTYHFDYAVEQELIANAAYVYRNGEFEKADIIHPYESFYLFVNEENFDNMECRFSPYYNGFHYLPDVDWEITISAIQIDGDEIVVGCSDNATDSFDNVYDLPEPPIKPIENGIKMYLPKDPQLDSLFIYSELNREIMSSLETGIPEFKQWNFVLETQILNAVTLEFNLLDLPEAYHTDIQIDGNSWNQLTSGNYIYSIIPSQTGTILGSIIISNNVASSDDIISTKYDFINFPNPFNPSTKIRFNVPIESKVELSIYNIKGQKVKTLCEEILPLGNHEYIWEGKNNSNNAVASGIYFIRLDNGEKTKVRKVLLLK
ncbi:MAG: T9SS type A sorting domain-containing protein [Candidatus Cloacimonadota bacterium]|nr:T9SS type A sorting domain-containing protein [Candidatus Cloacimonadota bacterium]